ncbi:hypothetical protein BD413DRAFT_634615 [Trametes elegans]|nr:hypothetical protein BD413DRAFT_634615 [Trametes elegans]
MPAMLTMQPMHPNAHQRPAYARSVPPRFRADSHGNFSNFSPWTAYPSSWNTTSYHEQSRAFYNLAAAAKPMTAAHPAWDTLISFHALGGDVFDPAERPERKLSPIGSRRHPRGPPTSTPLRPLPVQGRTPPRFLALAQAPSRRQGPPRPASAPPLSRHASLSALQEVDEKGAVEHHVRVPQPPLPLPKQPHSPSECAGDALCATHRQRPARQPRPGERSGAGRGPHKRTPLALWQQRPQIGQATCEELECMSRDCADCAYLRSRGGLLHTKVVRPVVERRLAGVEPVPPYVEGSLPLLRLRANYQVRRATA